MADTKRRKGGGILFGLVLLGVSIAAIWKNEHRFDYYKAARDTAAAESMDGLTTGALFSHTGTMDRELTLKGRYVKSFRGFLEVRRVAEIHAWNREEDDDGVRWSREWMSSLESNERNRGLKQELRSDTLAPAGYRVADLEVDAARIQFVDARRQIPAAELDLTEEGRRHGLEVRGSEFYLAKGDPEQLGDERVSYRGIPVPEVATYFGEWGGGRAVAHQAEVKEGFIAGIIQDKGVLHHLVAGSREIALATIKEHLAGLKRIVRIAGLVGCTLGGGILFSSLTRVLVFIPVVGPFINQVTGWIGMLVGFLLGLVTLVVAYLTSKPLFLAGIAVALVIALVLLARNAARKRERIRAGVAGSLGHDPSSSELAELEFIQLWQLAAANGGISTDEQRHLDQWTRRHGWSSVEVAELTRRAEAEGRGRSDHEKLEALIRYSLADGRIDRRELKTLRRAAEWAGIGKTGLASLMNRVQAA